MEKNKIYAEIQASFKAILDEDLPWESQLVSLIALLKESLSYCSWVGFYRLEQGVLWVGPYQGKLACLRISMGEGVCGVAVKEGKVQIVSDVHAFPGHIACDAESRSEIVLPVYQNGNLLGVLDLDSYELGAFDREDEEGLGTLLSLLA